MFLRKMCDQWGKKHAVGCCLQVDRVTHLTPPQEAAILEKHSWKTLPRHSLVPLRHCRVMPFSFPDTVVFSSNLSRHPLHSPPYAHAMTPEAVLVHATTANHSFPVPWNVLSNINSRSQQTMQQLPGDKTHPGSRSFPCLSLGVLLLFATPAMPLFWGSERPFQQEENHSGHTMPKKSQKRRMLAL